MMMDVENCRVCSAALGEAIYKGAGPGVTSLTTMLDVSTTVYLCTRCGHAQSEDLPDVQKFYDTEYRISLESDTHIDDAVNFINFIDKYYNSFCRIAQNIAKNILFVPMNREPYL